MAISNVVIKADKKSIKIDVQYDEQLMLKHDKKWTAGSGGAQSLFPGGISAREGAEEYHQPYHRVKQRGDDPPVCRLP